jgi:hypothetical protein
MKTLNKVIEFTKRNSILIIIGMIVIFFFNPAIGELKVVGLIILFELLAIGLSGLALYLYTEIKFTKEIKNDNKEYIATLGQIFLGVHIALGLSLLGTYFTQVPS